MIDRWYNLVKKTKKEKQKKNANLGNWRQDVVDVILPAGLNNKYFIRKGIDSNIRPNEDLTPIFRGGMSFLGKK